MILLYIILIILGWYLSGLIIGCFVATEGKIEELTFGDVAEILGIATMGPLLLILLVVFVINKYFEKNKDEPVFGKKKEKDKKNEL